MQNSIVDIIELRSQKCSYDTIQKQYSIGTGILQVRLYISGLSLGPR